MAHKIKRITSHRFFLPAVLLGLILLGLSVTFAYAAYTPPKTVTLDYLNFNNGTGEDPRQGFFSLELTPDNTTKRGFDFKNQKFTGLGDGAFYISDTSGGFPKFYGNNIGQGGLVDMGAVSIFETTPALQAYNRYGVDIKPGHVYSVYDTKNIKYSLISVRSASWDSTPVATPSLVLKSDPVDNGTGFVGLNSDSKTGTFGLTYSGPLPFNKTGVTWEYRREVLNCTNAAWNKMTCNFISANVSDTTILKASSQAGLENVSSNALTVGINFDSPTPVITPTPTCNNSDKGVNDGSYSACVGNIIGHQPSLLEATVVSYDDSKLILSISGMPGNNTKTLTVYKNSTSSVGGNNGLEVTYKYTGSSPTSGADITITSKVSTPTTPADLKTLAVGEVWDLGNGMTVTAQSVDARATPRQAWLTVKKGAILLDDAVVAVGQTYSYPDPSKGQPLVFKTKIYSIFSGATSDMVQFGETFIAPSSTPAAGGAAGSQAQPTPTSPVVVTISTSPASDSRREVYVNPGKSVVLTRSVTPGYVASNWEWTTSNDIFSCAPEGSSFVCSTNNIGATSITASAYVNGVKYTSAITNLYSKALTQSTPTSTSAVYFSDSGALADAGFITNDIPQKVLSIKVKAENAPATIRSLTFKENSTIYPFMATLSEQTSLNGLSRTIASQKIDQYGMLQFNNLNILIPANTVKYLSLALQGNSDGVTSGYQFYLELTEATPVVEGSPAAIGYSGLPVKGPLMTIKTITTSVQSANTTPTPFVTEEEEGDDFSEEGATNAGITDVANPKFGTSGGKNGFKFAVSMENNSGAQLPVILVSNSCSTAEGRISRQASKKYTLTGSSVTKPLFIPLSGSKSLSRVNSAKKNKDEITCNFELLDVNDDSLSVVEVDIVWDGKKWVVSDTRNDSDE